MADNKLKLAEKELNEAREASTALARKLEELRTKKAEAERRSGFAPGVSKLEALEARRILPDLEYQVAKLEDPGSEFALALQRTKAAEREYQKLKTAEVLARLRPLSVEQDKALTLAARDEVQMSAILNEAASLSGVDLVSIPRWPELVGDDSLHALRQKERRLLGLL